MNNAGGIDDDALLAGLPSWNDKIKLPFKHVGQNGMGSTLHNAESNTSDVGHSAQNAEATATTVTPEEDVRVALRLAALNSLKSRTLSKRVQRSSEPKTVSGNLSLTNTEAQNVQPATVESNSNFSHIKHDSHCPSFSDVLFSKKPSRRPIIPKRPDYTDVDAPEIDGGNELSYTCEENLLPQDSRNSRKRISYADEFSSRPEAPSGDDGGASWLDRIHGASSTTGYGDQRTNGRKVSEQERQSITGNYSQHVRAPSTPFFEYKPRQPMIIEWSDDEDHGASEVDNEAKIHAFNDVRLSRENLDITGFVNASATPSLTKGKHSNGKKTLSSLSEKEREIQAMLCKIKALEKKKQLQGLNKEQIETCTELKSTLGKRKAKDAESDEQIHTDVHANSEQSTKVCFWNELESNMVKRARMNYRSSLAWLKEGFTNVCRVFFFFFFDYSLDLRWSASRHG